MRAIKPTVELIQAPSEEYLESEEEETSPSVEDNDDFPVFFNVVNTLLGNMDDAFVNDFIASVAASLAPVGAALAGSTAN